MGNEVRPDVIIDYIDIKDNYNPMVVIYVRPETNEVHYEKAIILGIAPYADIAYLANLNGKLFIKDVLIMDHYSIQYRFAANGAKEILKYPEMVYEFETYFHTKFDEHKVIGSFDAMAKLNKTAEEIFDIIVDNNNFLKFYGQTIKKINDYYIINFNIPAIIKKYTPQSNVFVIAGRSKTDICDFKSINQSIFEQMKINNRTPILDENKLSLLEWYDKIKRTYHISNNNLMAMFDMIDFVFKANGDRLKFSETPLGRYLIEKHSISEDFLYSIKENPLVYIKTDDNKKKLCYLLEEMEDKSFEDCANLIKKIIT